MYITEHLNKQLVQCADGYICMIPAQVIDMTEVMKNHLEDYKKYCNHKK